MRGWVSTYEAGPSRRPFWDLLPSLASFRHPPPALRRDYLCLSRVLHEAGRAATTTMYNVQMLQSSLVSFFTSSQLTFHDTASLTKHDKKYSCLLDNTSANIPSSVSSPSRASASTSSPPPSPRRVEERHYTSCPITIRRLPSSDSLHIGPALSPPPPRRFRAHAHHFSLSENYQGSSSNNNSSHRRAKSTPLPAIPAPTAQKPKPTATLSFPLPSNLILSPESPHSDIDTQSNISTPPPLSPSLSISSKGSLISSSSDTTEVDTDLDISSQNGAEQLRDSHHRAGAILRARADRVCHLRGPEQSQPVRAEREGAGRGGGIVRAGSPGTATWMLGSPLLEGNAGRGKLSGNAAVAATVSVRAVAHSTATPHYHRTRRKVRFAIAEPAIADTSQPVMAASPQANLEAEVHAAALTAFKHKIALLSPPTPTPASAPTLKTSSSTPSTTHRTTNISPPLSETQQRKRPLLSAFPAAYSYLTESWVRSGGGGNKRRVSDRVRCEDLGWSWF